VARFTGIHPLAKGNTMRNPARIIVLLLSMQYVTPAATYTVAKNGDGQYTTIQAAVNAAKSTSSRSRDTVMIIDGATYEEQVTVDSTKSWLTVTSNASDNASRPVIRYCDKENVQPKNAEEAKNNATITYNRNGALRIIGAQWITVSNLVIDGGGRVPFAWAAVWNATEPLFHGNAAITLCRAGMAVISHCEVRNAWYGIYCFDLNEGGMLPSDLNDGLMIVPYSNFARTGNHLIEYNRICNNTWGIGFESLWDMGSTVRYNLFFENHHQTDEEAAAVAAMPGGSTQSGGAIVFSDVLYTPVAIHNNTFYHNELLFAGMANAGVQHLVFNNIFAAPWRDRSTDPVFSTVPEDLDKYFVNRMHCCVYSGPTGTPAVFPADAEVRTASVPFLSTDPASDDFLVPDRNNEQVKAFIRNKGWKEGGVVDGEGLPADIGAAAVRPAFASVVQLRPTVPVFRSGDKVTFTVSIITDGVLSDLKLHFIDRMGFSDSVGVIQKNIGIPVQADDVHPLSDLPSIVVKEGSNTFELTIPTESRYFKAICEMVVTGTCKNGEKVTSALGMIPFLEARYYLGVTVTDTSGKTVTEVSTGETYHVRIKTFVDPNTEADFPLEIVRLILGSAYDLYSPDGTRLDSLFNLMSGTEIPVVFHKVPIGNIDQVMAAGKYGDLPFLGASDDVKVLALKPDHVTIADPIESWPVQQGTVPVEVKVFDAYDNVIGVNGDWKINASTSRPDIASVESQTGIDSAGIAHFHVNVTGGTNGDSVTLIVALSTNGKSDTFHWLGGSMPVKTPRAVICSKPVYMCDLYTLQGKHVGTFNAGREIVSSSIPSGVLRAFGRGTYIMRLTDIATRKQTVVQRLVIRR